MSCTPIDHSITFTAVFHDELLPLCEGNLSDKAVLCKIAEQIIKGLSEFLIRHTNDEQDQITANNIVVQLKNSAESSEHKGYFSRLSQSMQNSYEARCTITAAKEFISKYNRFIKILHDSELCFNNRTPVIYCEYEQKITSSDIDPIFKNYTFNNPGISIKKTEANQVCFPVFVISQKAHKAFEESSSCTIL